MAAPAGPSGGADDRLLVDTEFAQLYGAVQVVLEAGLLIGQILLLQIDELAVVTAFAFGLVHGDVGVSEELCGVASARAGDLDADVGRYFHLDGPDSFKGTARTDLPQTNRNTPSRPRYSSAEISSKTMTIPNDPPAVSINPPSPEGLERIDTLEESNRQLVAEKQEMADTINGLREEISLLRDRLDAAQQQDRRPGP